MPSVIDVLTSTMRFLLQNTSVGRAIAGIAGGLLMICNVIVSYTYMHVVFFGAPHFALNSPRGRNEINYALASLLLIGFGALFIYVGVRAQRKHN